MGMDQNHLLDGYEPRSVERGARIVAILPKQPMAVLQMPRGNLEGVYPRALVLRFVMLLISKGQYGDAFTMMRRHKVDLNLLVDFDPWHFYESGISSFFQQVSNIDHLNLFLSGLQDWDITQSRFPVPAWLRRENLECKPRSTFDFSTKVNQICRKARSTMADMEQMKMRSEGHFLLPILSTFAKESPPKLDEALNLIKERALQHHPTDSKKPPLFGDKAQNAIHYLAFLAEYELLFETALGMYDFEIARAVARNSQMDPKVYLPLLKRLNSLPEHYAKYEVDARLKRYDAALQNLFESNKAEESLEGFSSTETDDSFGNSFENCMVLIERHNLHKMGLRLFEADQAKSRTILISLGCNLLGSEKSEAALNAFLAANPPAYEEAKRAARSAGDWRTFFSLLTMEIETNGGSSEEVESHSLEQRRQIARDVAKEMVAQKGLGSPKSKQNQYLSAARILLDYGDDLIGAIDMFISAECWGEAHRIAVMHHRSDLIKKCKAAAVEYAHVAMDDFHDKTSTFIETTARYNEVLILRKKNVFEEGPTHNNEADETGSLFSAASNMSNMSLQSTSSTTSGVSSIISIKSTTTFTMTGEDESNRHRSKFNKGKKQKVKKKRKEKSRIRPGSQEELNSLVFTMTSCCPTVEFANTITETIRYLIQVNELVLATEVFKSYNVMRHKISQTQSERIEVTRAERVAAEKRSRVEGEANHDDSHLLVEIPVEKEVDALCCAELEPNLQEFFNHLPIA